MKKLVQLAAACCVALSSACISADKELPPSFLTDVGADAFFDEFTPISVVNDFQSLFVKKWVEETQLQDSKGEQVSVNTCLDLIQKLDMGYESFNAYEYSFTRAQYNTCKLWDEIAKLQPSSSSYIENVELNEEFVKQAPPEMAFIISKDDERRLAKSSSWQEMSGIKNVKKLSDEQTIYIDSSDGQQRVTLVAKGDSNGDGVEDLLLYTLNSVDGGTYSSIHGFILTRLSDDGPYTLLKQW